MRRTRSAEAFLVAGENQKPRGKVTDGLRAEVARANKGEGGEQLWVRGGRSRPIPWRWAREVGLVDAQVSQQLEKTFLDRQRRCACHAPPPRPRCFIEGGMHDRAKC